MLRPPFFYNTDNTNIKKIAYNFGAIGGVIGHEIIHGFDDQGRLFDKIGNLNNWWDAVSEKNYKERTTMIGNIYKKSRINPNLTMGENIADIGGCRISLDALKLYLKELNIKFTDEILEYYVKGWAMVWRSKITPEEYEIRLLNDPHSPAKERVNIPLNNLKELNPNSSEIIEIW
jgi:putative endopeptidase